MVEVRIGHVVGRRPVKVVIGLPAAAVRAVRAAVGSVRRTAVRGVELGVVLARGGRVRAGRALALALALVLASAFALALRIHLLQLAAALLQPAAAGRRCTGVGFGPVCAALPLAPRAQRVCLLAPLLRGGAVIRPVLRALGANPLLRVEAVGMVEHRRLHIRVGELVAQASVPVLADFELGHFEAVVFEVPERGGGGSVEFVV